jgi:hypothetical protein
MKLFYLSQARFTNRIVKSWDKRGFQYNSSHIGILRYAFRTVQYWSNFEKQRVSAKNKFDTNQIKLEL